MFSNQNKKIYPNLESAIRPVNETDGLEIHKPQHIYLQMKLFCWNLMKSFFQLQWKFESQPFLI